MVKHTNACFSHLQFGLQECSVVRAPLKLVSLHKPPPSVIQPCRGGHQQSVQRVWRETLLRQVKRALKVPSWCHLIVQLRSLILDLLLELGAGTGERGRPREA